MKEKLKYNFLHVIPLHYSKFYNYFLLCCGQGCHVFAIPNVQTGTPESHFVKGGTIFKNKSFFKKAFFKKFMELPFRIATVFSEKI